MVFVPPALPVEPRIGRRVLFRCDVRRDFAPFRGSRARKPKAKAPSNSPANEEDIMKSILFAACAATIVATGALGASAGQFTAPAGNGSGAIIGVDDNRYDENGYYGGDSSWQYQNRGYNDDWRNVDYGHRDMISPRWIVRNLQQSDYRYISRPVLSGQFYQVKAVSPNGK
jgi:hypothetical protein